MWEISEGDTKFPLRYRISATIRSRVLGAQSVNVLEIFDASSLWFLYVRRCLRSEWHHNKCW